MQMIGKSPHDFYGNMTKRSGNSIARICPLKRKPKRPHTLVHGLIVIENEYLLLILEILSGDNVFISLSVKVTRNTVDHDGRNIAADQRTYICDEVICYICAFLIDP